MRELNLCAYRLSLNWSRILPEGEGRLNAAGLDGFRMVWTLGGSKRFGLIHRARRTLARTIKASGCWYARVIEEGPPANRLPADAPTAAASRVCA